MVILIIIAALACLLLFLQNKLRGINRESYYLYDNNLNFILLTFAIIATQIGGGMIVGVADASYQVGLAGLFYPLGNLCGLFIIAFFLGKFFKDANLSTVSAIFTQKYNFPLARKFASIISSISLFAIMVAQGIAIRYLLNSFHLSKDWLFILVWLSVILYTSLGGIKAVVHTNVLQIILITGSLLVLLFGSINHFDISNINFNSPVNNPSLLSWFVWPCCYMLIEQDMAQFFFSAKSHQEIKKAAIIAAFAILFLAFIPAFIGIIAKSHNLSITEGVLLFFAQNYLSKSFYIIAILAVVLAITSTVDSLLCAISSNIAYDFALTKSHTKYLSPEISLTFAVGIFSLIVVFYCENIINVLMFSYSLCVSALFVPSVLGFLLPKEKLLKSSAVLSSLAGISSLIALTVMKSDFTYLSILISLIAFFIPNMKQKLMN